MKRRIKIDYLAIDHVKSKASTMQANVYEPRIPYTNKAFEAEEVAASLPRDKDLVSLSKADNVFVSLAKDQSGGFSKDLLRPGGRRDSIVSNISAVSR